jgi:hypothetical protein
MCLAGPRLHAFARPKTPAALLSRNLARLARERSGKRGAKPARLMLRAYLAVLSVSS